MTWAPVASHGMTEEQVRAAIVEAQAELLSIDRSKWRAAGIPPKAIEAASLLWKATAAEQLERDLPMIMKNMAIGAGTASSH